MRTTRTKISIALSIFGIFACQESADVEAETVKILQLHHQQRVNNFQRLFDESADQLSDEFIAVYNGIISKPNKEEFIFNNMNYLKTVQLEKWDDINPPIIRFSENLDLAYAIVNKEMVVSYLDGNRKKKKSTVYSWVTIYKKYEDAWKIDCVVSTNKPSEVDQVNE